jgi:hypothetical protein
MGSWLLRVGSPAEGTVPCRLHVRGCPLVGPLRRQPDGIAEQSDEPGSTTKIVARRFLWWSTQHRSNDVDRRQRRQIDLSMAFATMSRCISDRPASDAARVNDVGAIRTVLAESTLLLFTLIRARVSMPSLWARASYEDKDPVCSKGTVAQLARSKAATGQANTTLSTTVPPPERAQAFRRSSTTSKTLSRQRKAAPSIEFRMNEHSGR